jgi:hypothetical protein
MGLKAPINDMVTGVMKDSPTDAEICVTTIPRKPAINMILRSLGVVFSLTVKRLMIQNTKRPKNILTKE